MTVTRSQLSLRISHRLGFSSIADQLIREGSEVGLILVVPAAEAETEGKWMWCFGKVLRVENELKKGKFGMAIGFQRFEVLSQA